MSVCALIPAYQPEPAAVETARALLAAGIGRLVVVDDGSTRADSAGLFAELAGLPRTTVLTHPRNQGKGAALKTGLEHILRTAPPGEVGAVMLDADGQHAVHDVLAVAAELERHPADLVLGCRTFREACVPLGRKIGSVFQRLITFLFLGRDIRDVQTGLRGIPLALIPTLLGIEADRYEWEMEMIWRTRLGPIRQIPVQSIYIGRNESSHFHPVRDTLKFYGKLASLRWRWLLARFAGPGVG